MRLSNRWIDRVASALSDDEGSAAVEFTVVGVILLVPLAYLVVALGIVQGQTLGVEAAARHVARAVATAEGPDDARNRADAVLRAITADYGIDPAETRVELTCRPVGTLCPAAGATVTVSVATTVSLPFVPPILGLDRVARIPVAEHAAHKVSRFWVPS